MTKLSSFDVLIVYSQTLAGSAASSRHSTPFSPKSRNVSYNTVYGHFLDVCRSHGLSAAFTTSQDIIGPGFCSSFWTYNGDTWQKNNYTCYSQLVFDKFSPTREGVRTRRRLLFSDMAVKPFNHPAIYNLFFDKQQTYDRLSAFSIPTVSLTDQSPMGVRRSIAVFNKLVAAHPTSSDFGADIIMKDRFGAGGRHIYRISSGQVPQILSIQQKYPKVSFILQPFVDFNHGFTYDGVSGSADIRLIYLNGQIIQTYIRMAKIGDFRCNEHQGGCLTYVPISCLPNSLIAKSNHIADILNSSPSLFALDFLVCKSGNSYLLEGNTGPGLDWNMSLPANEIEAKKLITMIVKELSHRTARSLIRDNFKDKSYFHQTTPVSDQ